MDEQTLSRCVGLLGASSLIGQCLLEKLTNAGWRVLAYSRQPEKQENRDGIEWRAISSIAANVPLPKVWISAAPIWVLPDYLGLLETQKIKRLIVLSSTSRYTKTDSSDQKEQFLVQQLVRAEQHIQRWSECQHIEWVILRPTLVYGLFQDKNIAEIARFIRRFGFFPVFGRAIGLRQPIHAEDVADTCVSALKARQANSRSYNLSGGETLSYRDMVIRIFAALGAKPRFLSVPLPLFRIVVTCLRCCPRYRHWSVAMAERMNCDLVFDHQDAVRDLAFQPRPFLLTEKDIS